ncbi:hypothetical protein B9Z55_021663 [Caenorhabditis nigoni]|uniref:Uncharacterized protein n=1 Tax=Caenorhabditis nigoni TaxID=1611254 RepID=A0A2G5TTW0_9PELO|nr:hypothetical protein B9Z55_021663 [Caenorhabditis nigoni]
MSLRHPSLDLFGESEHKNFLKQLLSFLEYYRRKIQDLATYIPIGKIIITCFNYLCSFFKKFQKSDAPSVEPITEISLENLAISGEKKKVLEKLDQEMMEERKDIEKIMLDLKTKTEDYDKTFQKKKLEAEKRIQEIEEKERREQEEKDRVGLS